VECMIVVLAFVLLASLLLFAVIAIVAEQGVYPLVFGSICLAWGVLIWLWQTSQEETERRKKNRYARFMWIAAWFTIACLIGAVACGGYMIFKSLGASDEGADAGSGSAAGVARHMAAPAATPQREAD
jgi:small-conductance mechanosensitive channel